MQPDDLHYPSHTGSAPKVRMIGENLRALRHERGLSLKQASARTSVSAATLSRIENGQMSPTFDVMARISDGLGVSIADLARAHSPVQIKGWMTDTRAGTGRRIDTPQYRFELLCDDVLDARFLTLRAEILCRTLDAFGALHSHSGREQIIVESGQVEVFVAQYKPKLLTVGDALAFDSRLDHAVIAPKGKATVLWIYAAGENP